MARRQNVLAGTRAERARGVEQVLVERLEGADGAAHVERPGDEQDRHHDGGLGEADRDAEHVERAAQQSQPPERGKQPDARHGRGQDERQLDQGQHQGAAAEPSPGDEVGGRSADEEDDRLRDQARLGTDDEGIDDDVSPQLVEERAGRDAEEDGGDRGAGRTRA